MSCYRREHDVLICSGLHKLIIIHKTFDFVYFTIALMDYFLGIENMISSSLAVVFNFLNIKYSPV